MPLYLSVPVARGLEASSAACIPLLIFASQSRCGLQVGRHVLAAPLRELQKI